MTEREALKLALEALEDLGMKHFESTGEVLYKETFSAIKEALEQPEQEYHAVNAVHKGQQCYVKAQPEQEPVAFVKGCNRGQWEIFPAKAYQIFEREQPLYTTPPQRKPLTDEEITDAVRDADFDWHYGWTLDDEEPNRFTKFARAIEAAHGIKGEA